MDDLTHFKDRTEAIKAFDQFFDQNINWILTFTGFSGLGKTTLLDWLEVNRCQGDNIFAIRLDLSHSGEDLGSLFHYMLEPLEPFLARSSLKRFTEGRREVLKRLQQVPANIKLEQTVLNSEVVIQSQAANLHQFYRDYEKQAERECADLWVETLRGCRNKGKILYLVDNYDSFQQHAPCETIDLFWTTLVRSRLILPGLLMVLASREDLLYVNEIQSLRKGLFKNNCQELEPLGAEDSDALLQDLGAADLDYRIAVYRQLAHGHPFVTRLAAEAWKNSPGGIKVEDIPKLLAHKEAVGWLQARILNELREPLREIAEISLELREFDADILSVLSNHSKEELQENFRKLITFSFVRPYGSGWTCHPLARQVQIQYRRREGPQSFKIFHKKAANYYRTQKQISETFFHGFLSAPEKTFNAWNKAVKNAALSYNHETWLDLIECGLSSELQLPAKYACEILFQDGKRLYYLSRVVEAWKRFDEARSIFYQIGDRPGEAKCIKSLGDIHLRLAEYPQAREQYEQAQSIYRTISNQLGEANCIQALGNVHTMVDEYAQARANYKEAQRIYQMIGERLGPISCIYSLGDINFRLAEYPQARNQYEEARLLYHEIGDRMGEANCIRALGDLLLRLGEYPQARTLYKEAWPIFHDVGDRLGEANCIKSQGDVHLQTSEYSKARECYDKARSIYHEFGARMGESICIKLIGDVHLRLAEYIQARMSFEVALTMYHEIGSLMGQATCLRAIGDVYLQQAEYKQARDSYEEAWPIYQAIGTRLGEANCIQSLGDSHLRLAEYLQARECYEKAQPIFREIGTRLGDANCTRSLGDVHLGLGEYPQARKCYVEAQAIYQSIGDRLGEANCYKPLGDVHIRLAEDSKARECYAEAKTIYHTIGDQLGEANCIQALGDMYLWQKDNFSAFTCYREAWFVYFGIGNRMGWDYCIRALGNAYLRLMECPPSGNGFEEDQSIHHAKKISAEEANRLITLGEEISQKRDWKFAKEIFLEALVLGSILKSPSLEAKVFNNFGNIYAHLFNSQLAIESFAQSIQRMPKEGMFYRNRASVYLEQRQLKLASEDLNMSRFLEPEDPSLYLRLGDLAILMGNVQKAVLNYQNALVMKPFFNFAYFGLGRVYLLQNNLSSALEKYRQGIEKTTSHWDLVDEIEELNRLKQEYQNFIKQIEVICDLLAVGLSVE
jgi:tetratricopeptide (TPR) repeat protein